MKTLTTLILFAGIAVGQQAKPDAAKPLAGAAAPVCTDETAKIQWLTALNAQLQKKLDATIAFFQSNEALTQLQAAEPKKSEAVKK